MTTDSGSFNDLATAVRLAVETWTEAVQGGDAQAADAARNDLLRALSAATVASVEALGRFSPFSEPGFFSEEAPDFNKVLLSALDLPAEASISRELVEGLAQAEGAHRDNPVHRELAKAMSPGALAVRAVMKLEREVIALRKELRGRSS